MPVPEVLSEVAAVCVIWWSSYRPFRHKVQTYGSVSWILKTLVTVVTVQLAGLLAISDLELSPEIIFPFLARGRRG